MHRGVRRSARQFAPLLVAVLMFAISRPALAGPVSGFGIYAGLIGSTQSGITTQGVGFGADAQFVINDAWSLNPYLMSSAEHSPDFSGTTADTLVGLQLRYWSGDWFVGPQAFFHNEIIIDGGVDSSVYGPGFGVLAGYEDTSGWGIETQFDGFEGQGLETTDYRYAVRLNLTYRWRRGPL